MADEKITLGVQIQTRGLEQLNKLKSTLNGISKIAASPILPFKGLSSSLKDLHTKLSGIGMFFKRVISYRILRSLVSATIRGFKEGIENLYAYSQGIGTVFNSNLDRIKESALLIKNATAAMIAPIINFVTPALEHLADLFANIANQIGFFIAKLTGAASFSAAIRGNLQGASSAAKDLKKQVFGFDELNILNAPSGGGEASNSGAYFEEWSTGGDSFMEGIRAAIEAQNFSLVGQMLADKLNTAIQNLPTASWGQALASKINNAVDLSLSFLRTFDARKLGNKIADFVNNALTNINWSNIGALAARKFFTIIDAIIGFVEGLDFGALAQALSKGLTGWFYEIADWIKGKDWFGLAQELLTDLDQFITNLDFGGVAKALFTALGAAISAMVQIIAGFISGVATSILEYFRQSLNYNPNASWIEIGANIIWSILKGILKPLVDIWNWVNENVVNPLLNAILDGFGLNNGESFDLVQIGKDLLSSIQTGLLDFLPTIKSTVESIVGWIKEKFTFSNISSAISTGLQAIGSGGRKFLSVKPFASGGYPDSGSLFIANEAGPELVGTIGGKTAVTNQAQFTQGLYAAVQPVVAAVLQMEGSVVRAIDNKDTNTYLDGRELAGGLYKPMQSLISSRGVSMVR